MPVQLLSPRNLRNSIFTLYFRDGTYVFVYMSVDRYTFPKVRCWVRGQHHISSAISIHLETRSQIEPGAHKFR